MLSINEVNILGNILNSTYGRSSSDTYSCKGVLEGDKLNITYSTMAYFASDATSRAQQDRLSAESNDMIADFVKHIKSDFKEVAETALKLKEHRDTDSLELVSATMLNPRRVYVYRRKVVFEILNGD